MKLLLLLCLDQIHHHQSHHYDDSGIIIITGFSSITSTAYGGLLQVQYGELFKVRAAFGVQSVRNSPPPIMDCLSINAICILLYLVLYQMFNTMDALIFIFCPLPRV